MDEIYKLEFLTQISYPRLFVDILLVFLCTYLIETSYIRHGLSRDNKKFFAHNLFNFTLAIFLIVSVIKTSIALSLGLVGALSIIRFRTAIKEPSQLIVLLILTAISISFAAEKEILGIIITIIYAINNFLKNKNKQSFQSDFDKTKIFRVSMKSISDLRIRDLIHLQNTERIYRDVNDLVHIEYRVTTSDSNLDDLILELSKRGEIVSYELV